MEIRTSCALPRLEWVGAAICMLPLFQLFQSLLLFDLLHLINRGIEFLKLGPEPLHLAVKILHLPFERTFLPFNVAPMFVEKLTS